MSDPAYHAHRLPRIWVVTDPTPESERQDICWSCTPEEFGRIAIGTGAAWRFARPAMYPDTEAGREAALADATARLRGSGASSAK